VGQKTGSARQSRIGPEQDRKSMGHLAIVGTGFVADLYMKSLAAFPGVAVRAVHDRDPDRQRAFAAHWNLPGAESLEALLAATGPGDVILNLTNPGAHHAVSRACLLAGRHVYSEKPLAMTMAEAQDLHALATAGGLHLASAPCSLLGEAAQTAWRALRDGAIGRPLLVYAELDDGFISQAPYRLWQSASGAPWPWQDEFRVGCTLEHAGYYLTWLIAMFGPVRTVVAASAELDRSKPAGGAPDVSVATLFFDDGVLARLTCSIIAPHDHSLTVIGETGTLEIGECWNNDAPVRIRRRRALRRRLVEWPFTRRVRLRGPTHPKVPRTGSAAMNFALGPVDMLEAIAGDRPPRMTADLALHLNEVTLAIQNAGETAGAVAMTTSCPPVQPADWAMAG
jgi:predicted dehydrogenase